MSGSAEGEILTTAIVVPGLAADATTEERLDHLRGLVNQALKSAGKADTKAQLAQRGVKRLDDRLSAEVQAVDERLKRWVKDEGARQVPTALWGVIITAVGMIMQAIASF